MIEQLRSQLIVSCQALPDEPLHGSAIMARMAVAAKEGGASGIRANGIEDIQAIQSVVDLPIIGIIKREYDGSDVYITPTLEEVDALVSAGVDLIALDATHRARPDGSTIATLFPLLKEKYPNQRFMADCATLEDAVRAERLGFDVVAPTLYGYTAETVGKKVYEGDFQFLREMVQIVSIPVIAEGNVITPEHARRVLEIGAYAVVVGGAITRPQQIAKRFVEGIHSLSPR
ncbi:N-acetylmannosamine-6-phosphate 2-epimerase [Exiguobacterium marinum]|uniref:Putative N-acetylmannosamine-6-phosphate 2-epimerase n=1 Tax=Exiguobacterium marinum TaxID=273528 RepID=A0ABY7WY34_9BACL|nr:N-acetylmannosamine-6-phosphate 2-epimerase [Exiguobacterium marinum]WDH75433.1 N-acetylmannosamine-6-phosphate 2-epimerase [Exiguobacterium marinum]